uniref:BolA-like protein n=1 Tax=Eutreptiella gymnastica TaxID=73025 RepID=A0A7S4CYV5_9EUGL
MSDEATIKALLETKLEAHHVEVINCTGACSGMKIEVFVVSELFEGKKIIERQRMVNDVLNDKLEDGTIHAVTIKTKTVKQYEEMQKKKLEEAS